MVDFMWRLPSYEVEIAFLLPLKNYPYRFDTRRSFGSDLVLSREETAGSI